MTVVGIAGGCALMLAGFAIKDSVSAFIQKQFVQIIKYDATISYSDESVLIQLNLMTESMIMILYIHIFRMSEMQK